MPRCRQNLWPFTKRASAAAKPARGSSMTVGQAMSKARAAGKASGDTGLFDSWLSDQGLGDRSGTLRSRLRREYEAGVLSTSYKGSRHAVTGKRFGEKTAAKAAKPAGRATTAGAEYKGRSIRLTEGGGYVIPSIDKESVFDSLKDAKEFIDSWGKSNPITDRAHRYRANNMMPAGPKVCATCGSKRNVVPDHKDGHPDHTWPSNLQWLCKSCNTEKGIAFARAGKGRLTHQYNPSHPVPTFEQYSMAVASGEREYYPGSTRHKKGAKDEAGAIIHATPKKLRSEYARRIAAAARGTRQRQADERWNPERELMTRAEALARAETIARTVPGAKVRKHAWNITVISKSGKHLVSYLGSKEGFVSSAYRENPEQGPGDTIPLTARQRNEDALEAVQLKLAKAKAGTKQFMQLWKRKEALVKALTSEFSSRSNPEPVPSRETLARLSEHEAAGYRWYFKKRKSAKGSFNSGPGAAAYLKALGFEGTLDIAPPYSDAFRARRELALAARDGFLQGTNIAHDETLAAQHADNPRRGAGADWGTFPLQVQTFHPRFVKESDLPALSNMWHLSRVPHPSSRYDRLLWTSKNFAIEHPEYSSTAVYKDLDDMLRFGGRNPATRANSIVWEPDNSASIRQAETARSVEELGRLHKHAVGKGDSELLAAVERRAAQLGFRHEQLTAAHPRRWSLNPATQPGQAFPKWTSDEFVTIVGTMRDGAATQTKRTLAQIRSAQKRHGGMIAEIVDSAGKHVAYSLVMRTAAGRASVEELQAHFRGMSTGDFSEHDRMLRGNPAKPVDPGFGKIYGDPSGGPNYITDQGVPVWMWRKGQRVRFYTADGVQVGPEHQNVAPAIVSAAHAGWRDPSAPDWLNERLIREMRPNPAPVEFTVWNIRTEKPLGGWDHRRFFKGPDGLRFASEAADAEAQRTGDVHLVGGTDSGIYYRTDGDTSKLSPDRATAGNPTHEQGQIAYDAGKATGSDWRGRFTRGAARKEFDNWVAYRRNSMAWIAELSAADLERLWTNFYAGAKWGFDSSPVRHGNPQREIWAGSRVVRLFSNDGDLWTANLYVNNGETITGIRKSGVKLGTATKWAEKQLSAYGPITRRNPADAAASLYESFHGKPATEELLVEEEEHEHEHLSVLGRLVEVWIETPTGLCAQIEFDVDDDGPVMLCSTEDGTQLYFEGGDQALDLAALKMDGEEWRKDRMVLGQFAKPDGKRKYNLTYHTRKDFDKFEPIDYQHDLGEETGVRPFLEFDPRNKRLYITGGQYFINQPLLETSPGIEN